jgi:predicted transcriptional regulator
MKRSNQKGSVGGSIAHDAAFLQAWHRAERGAPANPRVLAFENWEGLSQVMTGEPYKQLRHLHAHPEPSASALARALGGQYRRVHADVAALKHMGLLARSAGSLRMMADRITADIRL